MSVSRGAAAVAAVAAGIVGLGCGLFAGAAIYSRPVVPVPIYRVDPELAKDEDAGAHDLAAPSAPYLRGYAALGIVDPYGRYGQAGHNGGGLTVGDFAAVRVDQQGLVYARCEPPAVP